MPTIHIKGENAISNVHGKILDVRELRQVQREQGGINNYSGYPFKFDIVSPAYCDSIRIPLQKLQGSGRYLVHIYTPYSTYLQRIAVEIDSSGRPRHAFQIFKGHDTEPLYEEYPDKFPIPKDEIDYLEVLKPEEMGPK